MHSSMHDLAYRTLKVLGKQISEHRFRAIGDVDDIPYRALIASTHSSYLDAPALVFGLGRDIAFLSKKRFPFVGMIPVPFQSRLCESYDMLENIDDFLKRGYDLGVFPEGTRSKQEGVVSELKSGVLNLAERFSLPIVPVALRGASKVWPRENIFPDLNGEVVINVGPVFSMDYTLKSDRLRSLRDELQRLYDSCDR